jgi:hypothetical protein
MNSAKFAWENYCINVGFTNMECWDFYTNRAKKGFREVGRCDAKSLVVRPRTEGFAAMIEHEESGECFWIHVLSDYDMGIRPELDEKD